MLNLKELFKKRPFIYYIDGELQEMVEFFERNYLLNYCK